MSRSAAPLDRRHRIAADAAAQRRRLLRNQADPTTLALHQFYRDSRPEGGLRDVSEHPLDPDLCRAIAVHEAPEPTQRWKVEAYLISDLSYAEIGQRLGLSPRAAELYGLAFFDIRSLTSPQREDVLADLLGGGRDESSAHEAGRAWKALAAAGDRHGLDAAIEAEAAARDATSPDAGARNALRGEALAKLREAIQSIDSHDPQALRLIRHALTVAEPRGPNEELAEFERRLQEFFESLPITVLGPDPTLLPPMYHRLLTESACELTYEETMRASLGLPLPNEDFLLHAVFPKHRDDPMYPVGKPPLAGTGDYARGRAGERASAAHGANVAGPECVEKRSEGGFGWASRGKVLAGTTTDSDDRELPAEIDRASVREPSDEVPAAAAAGNAAASPAVRVAPTPWEQIDREWEDWSRGKTGQEVTRALQSFRVQYPAYLPPAVRQMLTLRRTS